MHFTKLHGCGNDFLLVDAGADSSVLALLPAQVSRGRAAPAPRWASAVRRLCDRRSGIGADGVIVVSTPADPSRLGVGRRLSADVRMRIFNADGSEAQMCGNGLRCLARFARERLGLTANPLRVEIGGRVLPVQIELKRGRFVAATVNMGRPALGPARVGALRQRLVSRLGGGPGRGWTVDSGGGSYTGVLVSMGNPHFVVFENPDQAARPLSAADVRRLDLARIGPPIERHRAFPEGMNAHFVAATSRTRAVMRTWERGAGLTQACGSGACAAVVAGVASGRLARDVRVRVPGGELRIRWDPRTGHVFMTGPAEEVCEGTVPIGGAASMTLPRAYPALRTRRLSLRQPSLADCPAIVRLLRDGVVARTMLGIPFPYRDSDARAWVAAHSRRFRSGHSVGFVITRLRPGSPVLIGAIGLRFEEFGKTANLGYWIAEPCWSKGYATEAARAVLRHAFEALRLNRVQATHFTGNGSSGRVMEKSGMRREGVIREYAIKNRVGMDCVQYAITRRDWLRSLRRHR